MPSTATTAVPGYIAGTWTLDKIHSAVAFTVRHLMVSKVRGRFTGFDAEIVTAENPLESRFTATVDLTSIDTDNPDRDTHIRSADFFEVEKYPTMTFQSTGIREAGDHFVVDGDLTLHGVTRPVALDLEVNGFQAQTPFGDTRTGFSATTEIDRRDFGIVFNMPLDGGGVVVGDRIQVFVEVEAILQKPAA
jgi:polyisoprenoid-binding protein YceI